MDQFLAQFENKEENKENVPLANRKLTFGKHRDQTYEYVYLNDPSYISWVFRNPDNHQYFKNAMIFWKERIENDYLKKDE